MYFRPKTSIFFKYPTAVCDLIYRAFNLKNLKQLFLPQFNGSFYLKIYYYALGNKRANMLKVFKTNELLIAEMGAPKRN